MSSFLAEEIEFRQGDPLESLVMNLIKIPSVTGDEEAIMEFAAGFLKSQGVANSVLGRTANRPNIVASLGSGEAPIVVLNGHLDTVPASSKDKWSSDPYDAVLMSDRIVGLGSLDMKGSCAAMVHAFCALARVEDQLRGTVHLQLVCDEEDTSYYGTQYLIEAIRMQELPQPDHVIVGEYSGLEIMTTERGSLKFWIHFFGRSSHTAAAQSEGRNAIHAASEAINLLRKTSDRKQSALSVNQISGGEHFGRVPDKCTILVDRRLIPGETMESAFEEVETTLETLKGQIPWLRYEIAPCLDERGKPRYAAPNLTPRDAPVAAALRKAHGFVTGCPARDFDGWFGNTDGRSYRYEGYDCVAYGPAGGYAHGPDEFVLLESLRIQLAVVTYATGYLCGVSHLA